MAGILNRPRPRSRAALNIRSNGLLEGEFWPNAKQLIDTGAVTPVISNYVAASLFGLERGELAQQWANVIGSPLSESENRDLARVAQYYSFERRSPYEAKRQYIDILKQFLLGRVEEEDQDVDHDLIDQYMDEFTGGAMRAGHDLAQIARQFGYPRVPDVTRNPLRLLADLPLPIYLTTSHHQFLEEALAATGSRRPESAIFYWNDALKRIDSIFSREPDYKPTPERPLVYHLFGLDEYPESLVFTEDDHLDCLLRLTTLMYEVKRSGKDDDLPTCVHNALSSTSLLLLGYEIDQWDFRILFKGLIQPTADSRKSLLPPGRAMQIKPRAGEMEKIEDYLRQFFNNAHFEIYWGDMASCVHALWTVWRGGTTS